MEKEEDKQQIGTIEKGRFGGYVVSGLIWYFAQSFATTTINELIVLVIAITSGFFYYRLKSKIKIKNEIARIILTFIILQIIAGISTGFLTALADKLVR